MQSIVRQDRFSDCCVHGVPLLAAEERAVTVWRGTACLPRLATVQQRAVRIGSRHNSARRKQWHTNLKSALVPRTYHALAILALALQGHLILACVFATSAIASEVPDPDPARFEQDIRTFEAWDRQNSFPPRAVLFVGSSSIRMWQSAECFPDLPLINRGFGGSHTSDVNHFTERIVLKYKPSVIVFYAGDNDIESGKSPQQVFDDFQAFASLVHKQLPQTRIIYLPIKPSLARWTKWQRMQEVNAHVEKLSKANNRIVYVDTATPMLGKDGRPRPELFLADGLHLNAAGYTLWTDLLRKTIAIHPAR